MAKRTRLDELDARIEGIGFTWSRKRTLTIRALFLSLVAILFTSGFIGLAHLYSSGKSSNVRVALQLNGLSEISEAQLRELVISNHLKVYWAGPQDNVEYLLNASNPTAIVLTILPTNRPPKGIRASYPQITTYVLENAFQAVLEGGGNPDVKGVITGDGNSVFYTNMDPNEVFVGLRGKNIELQIFDPSHRLWLALLKDPSRLRPIT